MLFRKNKLFGNNIPPRCDYCRFYQKNISGNPSCPYGLQTIGEPCKRYVYDPLKREPQSVPTLPKFTADDFKL